MTSSLKESENTSVGNRPLVQTLTKNISAITRVNRDMAFEKLVTRARMTCSPKVMTNRSISHARHVIAELFEFGLEHSEPVFVVSGSLNDHCYNQLTPFVARFDAQGIPIYVWVTDVEPDSIHSNFATAIRDSSISTLNSFPKLGKIPPHFVVVAKQAYRFETDHESAKAILSFNDSNLAASLQMLVQDFLPK